MLQQLFPPPACGLPLEGAYLREALRDHPPPLVYTNFITSLDGRIAQRDPRTGRNRVPPVIANSRDWWLYTELLAQADVVLASPSFLRHIAAGGKPGLLTLSGDRHAPLAQWRRRHTLAPHPALAVVTESLGVPAKALVEQNLSPLIITTRRSDPDRRRRLKAAGACVVLAGDGPGLSGLEVVDALLEAGHRYIYSVAGPRLLHTLLRDEGVDRLYYTLATTILGGEQFETLTRGAELKTPYGFILERLLLDTAAPKNANQLFAVLRALRH